MRRGVRPMNLEYKDARTTFDMPDWYYDASTEGSASNNCHWC